MHLSQQPKRVSLHPTRKVVQPAQLQRHTPQAPMATETLPNGTEAVSQPKRDISQVDSDENDDHEIEWEWIWSSGSPERGDDDEEGEQRKRRKVAGNTIVGAQLGSFECRVGDCVLLKSDGSNEAWVAMICEFVEDDGDGEKAANFMWFSTEKEIRSKDKKRNDFYWVCLLLVLKILGVLTVAE